MSSMMVSSPMTTTSPLPAPPDGVLPRLHLREQHAISKLLVLAGPLAPPLDSWALRLHAHALNVLHSHPHDNAEDLLVAGDADGGTPVLPMPVFPMPVLLVAL